MMERMYNGPRSILMDLLYDRMQEHYPGWSPDTALFAHEINRIEEEHRREVEKIDAERLAWWRARNEFEDENVTLRSERDELKKRLDKAEWNPSRFNGPDC
ncbi:MAG: hypothetical protein ACYDG4_13325 [Desulfuromonadaceae bacterium]